MAFRQVATENIDLVSINQILYIPVPPPAGETPGNVLTLNSEVEPVWAPPSGGGSGISELVGDVTAIGPGEATATLASVVTAGSAGDATHVPAITYDAKGRITSCTNTAISIPAAITALTGDVAATGPGSVSATLASVVTAGSAGDATHVPAITYDAKGRITACTNTAITYPAAITALTGDVTATGPNSAISTLSTVNSDVGTFGNSNSVPVVTLNAKGLVTACSVAAIQDLTPSFVGVYVSKVVGNDTTGTGSIAYPYASIGKAVAVLTASPPAVTTTIVILDSADYDENVVLGVAKVNVNGPNAKLLPTTGDAFTLTVNSPCQVTFATIAPQGGGGALALSIPTYGNIFCRVTELYGPIQTADGAIYLDVALQNDNMTVTASGEIYGWVGKSFGGTKTGAVNVWKSNGTAF